MSFFCFRWTNVIFLAIGGTNVVVAVALLSSGSYDCGKKVAESDRVCDRDYFEVWVEAWAKVRDRVWDGVRDQIFVWDWDEIEMKFESEFELSTISSRSQKTKLDGTNRTKSELLPNCVFLEKKSFPWLVKTGQKTSSKEKRKIFFLKNSWPGNDHLFTCFYWSILNKKMRFSVKF